MADMQRIQQARELHSSGDFARAIDVYEEVLRSDESLADVWHLKGVAEHQAGRLEHARASAARAIEAGGEKAPFLLLEGGVLHDLGEFAAAEQRFARAVAAQPNSAAAHIELGRVRLDQGKAARALEDFRAAVGIDPSHVRAWNNLGVALQSLDRLDDALRAFNHALTINPGYGLAQFNAARIFSMRADNKRALEHAQFAVRADASIVDAWLLIGDLERRNRESARALEAYRTAIRIAPGNLKARNAHAELLAEIGRHEEARAQYAQIAAHAPENHRAALGANLLLPQVYTDAGHLEATRRGYADGLERLHEAASGFRFSRREAALNEASWTNFYLAYQGLNDRELQARFGSLQKRVLQPVVPEFFAPRPRRQGGDRIRVGFLSHFFFNCTAGRYFAPWITRLDRARFETVVYYTNEWVADDTRTIAAAAGLFRHRPGRPLHALAQEIAADALDILVYPELGMHAETFTLAGLRLAPVQCCGWGHPNTTGLREMDWFISCAEMEPEDGASHYSERLALLPGLGTHYTMPKAETGGSRADFGLPEDRTIYFVPQSLFKIHPDNDELIARVLERDPLGVAVIFASHHEAMTGTFAFRLSRALERHGIDMEDRVTFLMPFMPHATYLRLNQLCDVMLDTLHWSGGNTSLDALASGLPLVTLPGTLMRGRQSQAMLRAIGVPELIATDADDYVEKAVALGTQPERRASIAARIAANRGALFERDEAIRELERLFDRLVQ